MVRLPLVPGDTSNAELAAVFDRFRTSGREVPDLYRALGNAPALLTGWTALAWSLRNDSTTDRGLRELAIIRIAQVTGAAYEWHAHRPWAEYYGVSAEQIAALESWSSSPLFSDEQRLILTLTDELTVDLAVTDATWDRLMAAYAPDQMVELVLTVAFYSCVSRVLVAFGIEPESEGVG